MTQSNGHGPHSQDDGRRADEESRAPHRTGAESSGAPAAPRSGGGQAPGAESQGPPVGAKPPAAEVFLRGPADLADALPYLLGFHPDDSIVMVALHGERGRFGGRIRLGIPGAPEEWPIAAAQAASCLEGAARARGERPNGALVFLCQDPEEGERPRQVAERLRRLAQELRRACGTREMPVYEALCVSGDRYWSYCCPDPGCCPPEGRPVDREGTSAMAATAAYAGIRVQGSLKAMEARLSALGRADAEEQLSALEAAGVALVPRMLASEGRALVEAETIALTCRLMRRFRESPPPKPDWTAADAHDDGLLSHAEAASLILGLQDREARDQAAEWMEGADVDPASRLWRAVARRCVGPYVEHAAAPLSLAGWVAWSGGDGVGARVALGRALRTDPEYVFAQLLHRACNDGINPEPLRRSMRAQRAAREKAAAGHDETAVSEAAP